MNQANTYFCYKIATKHQVANLITSQKKEWPLLLSFAKSSLTNKTAQNFEYETESLT